MTLCCPSCGTMSPLPVLALTSPEARDLAAELSRLRDVASALHMGHEHGDYNRVRSLEQAERERAVRLEEWDRSPFGRLLAAMGGAR